MLAALSPLRDRSNDAASRTPVGKGSASKPSRLGLTPAAATPKSAAPARSPLGAVDVNSASKGTPTVRGTPINAKENPRLAAKAAKPMVFDDAVLMSAEATACERSRTRTRTSGT